MPEYRRIKIKGGTYFFTVVTYARRAILTDEPLRGALRQGIQTVRQAMPFIIEAWVLLPDHLHAIWTLPENDDNFASRWAIIKRSVTRQCCPPVEQGKTISHSHAKRGEIQVWQRRFWDHLIRDETDFQRHFDYIHWNPVKHGYVQQVKDWPYSTFPRFVAQGLYPPDWGGINEENADISFGE